MKVIVTANNKGGQGKTTLSVILSHYFARIGKRTLAVDMDPQCNLSYRFLAMEVDDHDPEVIRPPVHPQHDDDWRTSSTADIFRTNGIFAPYPTKIKNLDILPGHSKDLLRVERVVEREVSLKVHKIFTGLMTDLALETELKKDDAYDVVVIDTGPSKGPLTTAALHAATDMIIPVEMEEMSIEGLFGMIAYWRSVNLGRDKSNPLNLVGVLPNKFDSRLSVHKHYLELLSSNPEIKKMLFPTVMHLWQDYKDITIFNATPIFEMPESSKGRKEAEHICSTVVQRMNQGQKQKSEGEFKWASSEELAAQNTNSMASPH